MIRKVFPTLLFLVISNGYAQHPQFQIPQLPEGAGKQLVEIACYSCHSSFNIVTSAGYDSADEWKHVFTAMVDLPDAQATTIAEYLAENFPSDEARKPVLIPGNTCDRY